MVAYIDTQHIEETDSDIELARNGVAVIPAESEDCHGLQCDQSQSNSTGGMGTQMAGGEVAVKPKSGYTDKDGFHPLEVLCPMALGEDKSWFTPQLVNAILIDDEKMLRNLFRQNQLVKAWQFDFADDGLGLDSPTRFSLLEFAKRQQAWNCVSALVSQWIVDAKIPEILDVLSPAFETLERSFDCGSECGDSKAFITACNVGVFRWDAALDTPEPCVNPLYLMDFPKATSFLLNDFSTFKVASKKASILVSKRLALRQRAIKAVANDDIADLGHALDALHSNAIAALSKNEGASSAFSREMEILLSASIACRHFSCVDIIIRKYIALAISSEKFAKLEIFIACMDILDGRCDCMDEPPLESLSALAINHLLPIIEKLGDGLASIPALRNKFDQEMPMLRGVLVHACDAVKARIESKLIQAAAVNANVATIAMPAKRVRL